MGENKRFELKSWHFNENKGCIYDNLENKELFLSIYAIIELLNDISQSEYDLKKFRDEICQKLDELVMLNEGLD